MPLDQTLTQSMDHTSLLPSWVQRQQKQTINVHIISDNDSNNVTMPGKQDWARTPLVRQGVVCWVVLTEDEDHQ